MVNYINDPNITKDYEFHLYDVVCRHCRLCLSGSHDWWRVLHKAKCKLANIKSLIGNTYPFFGVDNNFFKLGANVYEAVEDESDGYRSMMKDIKLIPKYDRDRLIFFQTPIAKVIVKDCGNDIYELVDNKDAHIWLSFGTRDYNDYYPCFTFDYYPKLKETND